MKIVCRGGGGVVTDNFRWLSEGLSTKFGVCLGDWDKFGLYLAWHDPIYCYQGSEVMG